jgi:hypothetical protein
MPDVYKDDGPRAVTDMEELMGRILDLVRKDTFRVLVEKVPEGKRHDSNTDPTYLIDSISSGRTEYMEHLEESFQSLDFDSSDHEAIYSSTKSESFGESKESTPESDDEEDVGSVSL